MNIKDYIPKGISLESTDENISEIIKEIKTKELNKETAKKLFTFIDLTTLNTTDNYEKVNKLCSKVNNLGINFPEM